MKLFSFTRCQRPEPVTKTEFADSVAWIIHCINSLGNRLMTDLATAQADQAAAIAAVKQAFTDAFSVLGAKIDAQAAQIATLNDQLHQAGNLTGPQQDAVDAIDAGARELQALAAEVEAKLTPAPAGTDTPAPADAPSGDGPTS